MYFRYLCCHIGILGLVTVCLFLLLFVAFCLHFRLVLLARVQYNIILLRRSLVESMYLSSWKGPS